MRIIFYEKKKIQNFTRVTFLFNKHNNCTRRVSVVEKFRGVQYFPGKSHGICSGAQSGDKS